MTYKSSRVAVAIATVGLALAASPSAHAFTLKTRVTPGPEGYVYCKVCATSKTPIGITASIISDTGTNVTDFGSGFHASPGVVVEGLFYAEETAGSFDGSASYCKATVTGARRSDVHVSLDANDDCLAAIGAR